MNCISIHVLHMYILTCTCTRTCTCTHTHTHTCTHAYTHTHTHTTYTYIHTYINIIISTSYLLSIDIKRLQTEAQGYDEADGWTFFKRTEFAELWRKSDDTSGVPLIKVWGSLSFIIISSFSYLSPK